MWLNQLVWEVVDPEVLLPFRGTRLIDRHHARKCTQSLRTGAWIFVTLKVLHKHSVCISFLLRRTLLSMQVLLMQRKTGCWRASYLAWQELQTGQGLPIKLFLLFWVMAFFARRGLQLCSPLPFFRAGNGNTRLIHSKPAKGKVGPLVSFSLWEKSFLIYLLLFIFMSTCWESQGPWEGVQKVNCTQAQSKKKGGLDPKNFLGSQLVSERGKDIGLANQESKSARWVDLGFAVLLFYVELNLPRFLLLYNA